jgi:hypothetical protein
MRVCYLDCHEAGLCCYLVVHIENLLRQLKLFYFHLWHIYWLSLAVNFIPLSGPARRLESVILPTPEQDYIAPNGRIIDEWWIGKDSEGSGSSLIETGWTDSIPVAFVCKSCQPSRCVSVCRWFSLRLLPEIGRQEQDLLCWTSGDFRSN